jgi:hypothetical protein
VPPESAPTLPATLDLLGRLLAPRSRPSPVARVKTAAVVGVFLLALFSALLVVTGFAFGLLLAGSPV